MYLLPLILSNTFWCLFVFSVSLLGRQPIRGLCLPPFRANYSAGAPSSVRETAGETAAALFGSYLPSSSSLPPLSSSAWVAMAWRAPGPAIISTAFASDFLFWRCSSFQPSFLLLFPFVAAQCVHQELPVNVSCRLDDRPEDRQGTDGRQEEGMGLRRKAASQVVAPINSIAHLHIWGSGRHQLSLSPSLTLSPSLSLSDGSLAASQLCLFWMTNAILPPVSWWFNPYRVTLPKQHYPCWESGAVVAFPAAAKRRAWPLQWTVVSRHQSQKSRRPNPFFPPPTQL